MIGRTAVLAAVGLMTGCGGGTPQDPWAPDVDDGRPLVAPFAGIADHDVSFDVEVSVTDPEGDPVTVQAVGLPGWLTFDAHTRRFSGIPGEAAIGSSSTIRVTASDGTHSASRTQTINVRVGTSTLVADGPWLFQTPHRLLHDGAPLEWQRFRIYSGFASTASRARLAGMLETSLDTLSGRLGVASSSFDHPPGGQLHVFADKLQADGALGAVSTVNGWAFRDGMIVMSDEAPRLSRLGYTPARYRALVTHELMHDLEFLLIGRSRSIGSTDAWFREGIATYMAGLAPGGVPVTSATTRTLADWRSSMAGVPGGGNPIGIHTFSDFPSQVARTDTYYFWFAQAIRYLVSDDGFGLGENGLAAFYSDIRGGLSFAASFRKRTGVDLAVFEAEFWDRIGAFLS